MFQADEQERLKRLEQQRRELLEKAFIEQIQRRKEWEAQQYYQQQNQLLQLHRLHQLRELQREQELLNLQVQYDTITVSSGEESEIPRPLTASEDNSKASQKSHDEELEDRDNSGMHVDDKFNVPNEDGRVLINVAHPTDEPDIFLPPQIARIVKPHQIGGIRFLYDNLIESLERYKTSQGFGCILAHAMGLGKTLQVVSFVDIFLRHTPGKKVLCIVPINTIQNWLAEFNKWIPETQSKDEDDSTVMRFRDYKLYLLNDTQKNLDQRSNIIFEWESTGGVLLIGYELFRMLATKQQRRKRKKKIEEHPCIDLEEEDREKSVLNSKSK